MKKFTGVAILLLFWSLNLYAQNITTSLYALKLPDINGKLVSFNELKLNKASVIVFLSPDCPLCENYTRTLKQMNAEYSKSAIKLYGIFSGNWYPVKDIKEFRDNYGLDINMLLDTNKVLSRLLKAKVTPEAVVVNNQGKIVYQGRIDNWMYAVGKKRTVITKHELKDALDAIVSNRPIAVSKTEAVGCIIE